jgi:ABC-2 type transport system permease protein
MRFIPFASRNVREIVRDPVSALFGVGLPVALLLLMSLISRSIPGAPAIFDMNNFAPGMAMFSMSFLSLFCALLIAGDRGRSYLSRLFASPMGAWDYILGYSLPLLPLGVAQTAVCFGTAVALGLEISGGIALAMLALLPCAAVFVGLGMLLGSLLTDRQAGPLSSIVVQMAALSSGMWFDLRAIGGAFAKVCYALPFAHAVDMAKGALVGDFAGFWGHFAWVAGYALALFAAAAAIFKRKMKN